MNLLSPCLTLAVFPILVAPAGAQRRSPRALPDRLYVDAERGRDSAPGTERRPLRTMSAALEHLPEVVAHSITIEVRGVHDSTGGHDDMADGSLALMRRTRPGATVTLVGRRGDDDHLPVLGWHGGGPLIDAREGTWRIENFQIGTGRTDQRRGVAVRGPAQVTLKDIRIRTRSHSDAGIRAERGGCVLLRGAIRLNEQLHGKAPDETFCGIVATDHGMVRFVEREGASLELGNGSLSASYYGSIELGCATARITSWGRQSNCLAVNDSGRVDLHSTTTTLCARVAENTPIGPEHDGHILAEGAHIIITGSNDCAITLQKASTLTCNDIDLRGHFRKAIWAMSGSMFVGRFLGDIGRVEAHTGASVHIEACAGAIGEVVATSGAVVSLPGGKVVRGDG